MSLSIVAALLWRRPDPGTRASFPRCVRQKTIRMTKHLRARFWTSWHVFVQNRRRRATRAGCCGLGEPMSVEVGYTTREICDGQSPAPPGRWPPGSRWYPTSSSRTAAATVYRKFTERHGTGRVTCQTGLGKSERTTVRRWSDKRT